jgi:parallel beta helix pectate lyase-like protein
VAVAVTTAASGAKTGTGAVCDKQPPGPATAPAGAVTVDAGTTGDLMVKAKAMPAGTTFWLGPGTHKLGGDQFDQVEPKDGDVFIGAPGAILDGQRINLYAFTGEAKDVAIRNLTVQGFVPPQDQGVVNHDSGDGWVIEHNTLQRNSGAALMAGVGQQVRGNCLRANGQYGMNAYKSSATITGLVLEGNEIVGNNTDDWETKTEGCGCTGGVKFWAVNGADIRGNWVHDNRGVALWADTNDNDFLIEGNVIEENDDSAIIYEASYNAVIRNNTIRRNNWVAGKKFADRRDNFPVATIYLSEAGGEPRVKARTDKIDVYGNVMENNWSGITLWENADRFCNSPANTSSDSCTMLVSDKLKCAQPAIATEPLFSDCRWKTQRVDIHDNKFALDPESMGCRSMCGRMAILSNFGTFPEWSPYRGATVQNAITSAQHNQWHANVYTGPWTFMAHDTGTTVDDLRWQHEPYMQDQGSTFVAKGGG